MPTLFSLFSQPSQNTVKTVPAPNTTDTKVFQIVSMVFGVTMFAGIGYKLVQIGQSQKSQKINAAPSDRQKLELGTKTRDPSTIAASPETPSLSQEENPLPPPAENLLLQLYQECNPSSVGKTIPLERIYRWWNSLEYSFQKECLESLNQSVP
jgi:hypothetical protein